MGALRSIGGRATAGAARRDDDAPMTNFELRPDSLTAWCDLIMVLVGTNNKNDRVGSIIWIVCLMVVKE